MGNNHWLEGLSGIFCFFKKIFVRISWTWSIYSCEIWTTKKTECQRIDAFKMWCWRRLLRVPWTTRRLNHSILKEINPEYSLGRTDAEAEAPILWPPDMKSQLTGKDRDAGKDWGQEEKGATEHEMLGWHHWLNGHIFAQTLWDSEEWGSLASCSPWGCTESNKT